MQRPVLSIPEPKLASLSFCEANPKSFRKWVSSLPMANLGELSRQLYHAIIELNQLFTPPSQRLQLLELIRPGIRFVCAELARHYLGMAIAMPEKQRKIANLSQALQIHLAAGYKLALLELLDSGSVDKNRKLLTTACHRAISELGATILRAQQLYTTSPAGSWRESHQLFKFACQHKLEGIRIADETLQHRSTLSIAETYHQTLMTGCARTNQLRQNELEQARELLELWAESVTCKRELASSAVFVVDMNADRAPTYQELVKPERDPDLWGFDTAALAEQIQDYLRDPSPPHLSAGTDHSLPRVGNVSNTLLAHFAEAFAVLTQRNFNRHASEGQLEICAGLSAVHFFAANQVPFNEFIVGNTTTKAPDDNRFMKPARRDAWSDAFDAGVSEERAQPASDAPIDYQAVGAAADPAQARSQPRSFLTRLINTSPGGYCVDWSATIPSSLQAGEILGVREQRTHTWSIAVVRWLRQARGEGTRVGIELMAPHAAPCGIRLLQKTGASSEYLRGLLLPEIPGIQQPASLITPKLPFQSGSRITLLTNGAEQQGTLGTRLAATGSISQFELRLYNQPDRPSSASGPASGTDEGEFDSLWPTI